MTSISLLEKWWFDGAWPNASIRCKGVFIGAELITVGDTVRIAPEATSTTKPRKCTDVLVVESIRLNLLDIKPEHVSPESPLLSSRSSITLVGKAYTIDIHRHYKLQGKVQGANMTVLPPPVPKDEIKTIFRPVGSSEYGSWYHLHDPAKRFEVSYDEVLGRLYEAAAVQLWTGMLQGEAAKDLKHSIRPRLDYDMPAIEEGRRYATQADLRLEEATEGQISWFWADTRAEALDIETINGLEVTKYHDIRDKQTLEAWRTQLRILNGHPIPTDLFKFTSNFPELPGGTRGRKPGSKVVNGRVIMPGAPGYDEAVADHSEIQSTPKHKSSQLAGAALVSTDDEEDVFEDAQDVLSTIETHPEDIKRRPSPAPKPKPARTKQQIMSTGNAYLSDEDDWYNQPLPVRGGTEESEGGDYNPGNKSD
jgi:ATP-binding cassette subfamily D (ALD) long-chain fatty acid import protein